MLFDSKTQILDTKLIIRAGDWIFHLKDTEPAKIFLKNVQSDAIELQNTKHIEGKLAEGFQVVQAAQDDQEYQTLQDAQDVQHDQEAQNVKVVQNVQDAQNVQDVDGICCNITSNVGPNKSSMGTVDSQFVIPQSNLTRYWDVSQNSNPQMKERRFHTTRIGFDWPRMYGSPCIVIIKYNHALKSNSKKLKFEVKV